MNPKLLDVLRKGNDKLAVEGRDLHLDILAVVCSELGTQLPNGNAIEEAVLDARLGDALPLLRIADDLVDQKYTTAAMHFAAHQIAALVRKFPWQKDQVVLDPEAAAKQKFWHAEHKCHRVNQRFVAYRKRSPYELQLSQMRSWIQYVLGPSPCLEEVFNGAGFGPGANVGIHGNATNLARKILHETWSVSPGSLEDAWSCVVRLPHLVELLNREGGTLRYPVRLQEFTNITYVDSVSPTCFLDVDSARNQYLEKTCITPYNKIAFVPKTAKTHRTIAVEPLLTLLVQKGIGTLMRKKLKRVGVNLQDQAINQRMAREGSVDPDSFVTIDLESASDSVSRELVRTLLPPDWYDLLDRNRCKSFMLDGVIYPYNKFCSMGNDFCFPLESLLFAAATQVVGAGQLGRDVAVYGDDIIVRARYADGLISLLGTCGFTVNKRKTFLQGPFRESCGADWFGGEDVRPMTLDFALDSVQALFKFLNLTRRNERTTRTFDSVRPDVLERIPESFRFLRPHKGNEDSGIDATREEFLSGRHHRWNKSLQCWSWKELSVVASADKQITGRIGYDIALAMGAVSGVSSSRPFTLRRKTKTNVRVNSHGGATSTVVPLPGLRPPVFWTAYWDWGM